jgi:hypothetical protein
MVKICKSLMIATEKSPEINTCSYHAASSASPGCAAASSASPTGPKRRQQAGRILSGASMSGIARRLPTPILPSRDDCDCQRSLEKLSAP